MRYQPFQIDPNTARDGEDYLAWAYDVNDISLNSWGIDHCWRTAYSADCPFACPSNTSSCPCDECDGDDWSSGDLS